MRLTKYLLIAILLVGISFAAVDSAAKRASAIQVVTAASSVTAVDRATASFVYGGLLEEEVVAPATDPNGIGRRYDGGSRYDGSGRYGGGGRYN